LAYAADSHFYSAGLQLTPNNKRPENYLQMVRYQLGAGYNRSYLMVNSYQQQEYYVSMGVGIPFRNFSYVNIALNVGESGTGKRGGITERYFLVTINMSLVDQWLGRYQWH
jgi:hypothetical protein